MLFLTAFTGLAEPAPGTSGKDAKSSTAPQQVYSAKAAARAEQVRLQCIEGRRYIAGRVLQILPEGLVVDSGYSQLLSPPLNHSWLANSTVSVKRDANTVEERKPDALCVGLVLLSNYPKKPQVKEYDYVVMHGYPAGDFLYTPVVGVQKTIRRFSASLDRAVQINVERESK